MIVKATCGTDAPERCSQAFTVAAAAVAAGVPTSLWLTGEAAWLALPGRAEAFELDHAGDLAELRDLLIMDGQVTVCTQCAARRGITESDLVPGIRIGGASSFVAEALADDAQALVY
jgi:predicted peroxiredoxin